MICSKGDFLSPEGEAYHVWRLRFCRLKPLAGVKMAVSALESHPAARLPHIDIAIPVKGYQPGPAVVLGPDGLVLFEANTQDSVSPAVVLDWKNGEARGVGAF